MECSSKEMTGVHEIFETAINTVVAEQEGLLQPPSTAGSGSGRKEKAQNYCSTSASRNNAGATPTTSAEKPMMLAPSKKKKRSGCKFL